MAITFDTSGRPAYMFKGGATSSDGVWYPVGAQIDTTAAYEFTGANSFTNTVSFDDAVTATQGFNNFLNPAARDAALATPVRGTIAFVRQDSGGAALNQIQFYDGSAWVPSGDVFGVTAGTGISGGGTSGTVTVSVDDTIVATTSNTLTMTNKTLTAPIISSISNTGTLTLPTSTDTLVGRATTDTLTNKTLTNPLLSSPEESTNIIGSAPTATQAIDFVTSGVHYFTSNSTSNITLNFRGDGSTTLNSMMAIGGSITVSTLFTNGATAYYASAYQIDGNAVTPKWSGGTAPTAGNASSVDLYSFNIVKTANATFTVFASGASKFA
jgi:hypothetical protein